MKFSYYIVIASMILSCNSQPRNITIKESPMNWNLTTIPTETGSISFDYRLNQYFLLDSLTGFMIGNNSGTITHKRVKERLNRKQISGLYENYQTILFKTVDGGLSFKKITVGKGTLSNMTKDTQGNLYVIKEVYEKDGAPPQYTILKSTNVGETWQEIGGFKTQKIFNVRFYDANKGIVSIEKGKGVELLKTIDGGRTWETLIVKVKGVDIYNPFFINENELYTTYEAEDTNATATVNFNTGKTIVHQCNLPKGYSFNVFFNDDVTGNLYSEVLKYGELHPLMLYNHTTQKLITYDFKNNRDQTNVGVSISGNYIAVLRSDNGKIFYYYSKDNGKNWIKESLPDYLADSHPIALYGKGLVWVKSIRNLYNLQVRKPSFQN